MAAPTGMIPDVFINGPDAGTKSKIHVFEHEAHATRMSRHAKAVLEQAPLCDSRITRKEPWQAQPQPWQGEEPQPRTQETVPG